MNPSIHRPSSHPSHDVSEAATEIGSGSRAGLTGPAAHIAGELTPGQRIGRCTVVGELGRGGMGAVYRGHHEGLGVPVAIKILSPQIARQSPDFVQRFLREARLAAQIRHPNVVSVLDVDQDRATGLYFIVQEFIGGGSVGARLKAATPKEASEPRPTAAAGSLPEAEALAITAGIAEALEAAEALGIVHRDIKPDNILLTEDGRPKLADLGLAKQAGDQAMTQSQAAMGTPQYMSPEQIDNPRDVDRRSDLYSLGVTLYVMLTGETPFQSENLYGLFKKIMDDPVPEVRYLAPKTTARTAAICHKLMAKKPEDRFQSAKELLSALRGQTSVAAPSPKVSIAGARPQAPSPSPSGPETLKAPSWEDFAVPASPRAAPARGRRWLWWAAPLALLLLLFMFPFYLWRTKDAVGPAPDPIDYAGPTANGSTTGGGPAPRGTTPASGAEKVELSFDDASEKKRLYLQSYNPALVLGAVGQGMSFDGIRQHLVLKSKLAPRSMAFWFKADEPGHRVFVEGMPEGTPKAGEAWISGTYSGQDWDHWKVPGPGLFLGFWQVDALVPFRAFDGKWHHVAWSVEGQSVTCWINGERHNVEVRTTNGWKGINALPHGLFSTALTFQVATAAHFAWPDERLKGFRGSLDELTIRSEPMSDAEVQELYNARKP